MTANAISVSRGRLTSFPRLCAIIFEGRAGSSELISRLNSHPDAHFYPEVLATLARPERTSADRWREIEAKIHNIARGKPIGPVGIDHRDRPHFNFYSLRVVGFKTRLNEASDKSFFRRHGRLINFYVVEGEQLTGLLERYNAKLIRLRRGDLLRSAVSWLRALELNARSRAWNRLPSEPQLGQTKIDVNELTRTMDWVEACRAKHDDTYAQYRGEKIVVEYEDMFARWPETEARLLAFLGLRTLPLAPYFDTPNDLDGAVSNLDEVLAAVAAREAK